jgi:hypothetical protein
LNFSSCRYPCIEVVIYQLIEGYLKGIAGLQKILECPSEIRGAGLAKMPGNSL